MSLHPAPTTSAAESSEVFTGCVSAPGQHDSIAQNLTRFQFTFVTNGDAAAHRGCKLEAIDRDSLVLYHPGEPKTCQLAEGPNAQLWIVQFDLPAHLLAQFPSLACSHPSRRRWRLRAEQIEIFRWMFVQIHNETLQKASHHDSASHSWLRLLLINVNRWATENSPETIVPKGVNPDILRLWHVINANVDQPNAFRESIQSMANYDSLRHTFKRVFKVAPSEMMTRLRMQQARRLLSETTLSIKEIAYRSGYYRQHEFTRAFRRENGVPPTAWREMPVYRLSA